MSDYARDSIYCVLPRTLNQFVEQLRHQSADLPKHGVGVPGRSDKHSSQGHLMSEDQQTHALASVKPLQRNQMHEPHQPFVAVPNKQSKRNGGRSERRNRSGHEQPTKGKEREPPAAHPSRPFSSAAASGAPLIPVVEISSQKPRIAHRAGHRTSFKLNEYTAD